MDAFATFKRGVEFFAEGFEERLDVVLVLQAGLRHKISRTDFLTRLGRLDFLIFILGFLTQVLFDLANRGIYNPTCQ